MRVLVASTGNVGHFSPVVPLARALEAAGDEVRVATPASFADRVRAHGFAAAPVDDPAPDELEAVYRTLPRPGADLAQSSAAIRDLSNLIMVRDVFGGVDARAALPGMLAHIDAFAPDLVLREPAEVASLVASQLRSVPHVQYGIGTVTMVQFMVDGLRSSLAAFERELDLADRSLADAALRAPLFTHAPEVFDEGSVETAAPRSVHRFRLPASDRDRGGALPSWGDPDAPLVYATFGSVAATMAFEGLYRSVMAALGGVDARVLLTTGEGGTAEALRPWPDNVRVEQWWPQAEVMPHTAAMVGHGGFGTTTTALAAGVPQVVIPLFATDQWINAARVRDIGVGLELDAGPDLADVLADAVRTAIEDPRMRAAARAVRNDMVALPHARDLVQALHDAA
ncbi:glycosyltransferase [Microbacter sp. GSS18]|nr:glycosyltransferase [Microbacter sp. GSS18]